jgi:hypothetical protein
MVQRGMIYNEIEVNGPYVLLAGCTQKDARDHATNKYDAVSVLTEYAHQLQQDTRHRGKVVFTGVHHSLPGSLRHTKARM